MKKNTIFFLVEGGKKRQKENGMFLFKSLKNMGKHYLETFTGSSISITKVIFFFFTNVNKHSWNFIAIFPQLWLWLTCRFTVVILQSKHVYLMLNFLILLTDYTSYSELLIILESSFALRIFLLRELRFVLQCAEMVYVFLSSYITKSPCCLPCLLAVPLGHLCQSLLS